MFRRQVKRSFRKPLIVMTPKSMLRTPTSSIEELFEGSFQEILDDPSVLSGEMDAGEVERVVLCSGKLYHELAERRDARGDRHIAIVRIEQFYPFHATMLSKILNRNANRTDVAWVQEEPRNAGAFLFITDCMRTELGIEARYIGREASATPAVGSKRKHKKEQEAILSEAIGPAQTPA
jgi:2-oxoglutarate dehydrogenase E1 component